MTEESGAEEFCADKSHLDLLLADSSLSDLFLAGESSMPE
jgi:hypothetical protein